MQAKGKYLLTGLTGLAAALLLMAVVSGQGPATASGLAAVDAPARLGVERVADQLTADPAAVARMAMVGQVVAAIAVLDNSGFHDMDEAINNTNTAPSGSLGRVRRARLITAAVMWPPAAQESARKLQGELGALLTALQNEDLQAAKGPVHEVHEIAHDLSDMVYTWLGEVGGLATSTSSGAGSGSQGMEPQGTSTGGH